MERKDTPVKENIKESILLVFPDLLDLNKSHAYFCSYDNHPNEEYMIEFWNNVVRYIFSHKDQSTIKISQIIDYLCVNGRKPIGIVNIIKELIKRGEYITSESINSEELYQPKQNSLLSYITSTISSIIYSKEIKDIDFQSNLILFDKFKKESKYLEEKISIYCLNNDILVFILSDFKSTISNIYDETFDLCITYLQGCKKIKVFESKIGNVNQVCVKKLTSQEDTIDQKDTVILNIAHLIFLLENKINELDDKSQAYGLKVREYLKNNNKQRAKQFLAQQKIYQKSMDLAFDKKTSLEQQLIDIKHMSNSVNILNILKECDKVNKSLLSKTQDIDQIIDDIKDNKDDINDRNEIFQNYNNYNVDNDDLDKELLNLLNSPIKQDKSNNTNSEYKKENDFIDPNMFPSVKKSQLSLDELIKEFKN